MLRLFKACLLLLFIISSATVVYSDTSWITKKSDKTKVEKKENEEEKKKKKLWIKKKIKENKEEFKKEEKKISKEVKTYITKKIKEKYIDSIDKLPDDAIYFTGFSSTSGLTFYGYVQPDVKSKLIENYYETSTGFGYLNDGKTVCKIGSTILIVLDGEVTARISGNCSNGLKFTGKTTQTLNSGWGSAQTADGADRFNFDFNNDKTIIAVKFYENDKKLAARPIPKSKIKINPTGKYYALLIGNSKYVKWASLKSPINDTKAIKKILLNKYNFEDVNLVLNATRFDIFEALKKLRDVVTPNDYVLIYYSGHGQEESQRGYWIPVNGEKEWDPEWIDSITVKAAIQRIKARHILLMVDSCYLGSSFKGESKEIETTEAEKEAEYANKVLRNRAGLLLASGGSTPVVDAVIDDKHSLFAYKFLSLLEENNNFILSSDIAREIKRYHGLENQNPQYYSVPTWGHLDGDFVFVVKKFDS